MARIKVMANQCIRNIDQLHAGVGLRADIYVWMPLHGQRSVGCFGIGRVGVQTQAEFCECLFDIHGDLFLAGPLNRPVLVIGNGNAMG